METTHNNDKKRDGETQDPYANFPSKNFSQHYESRPVDNSEIKTNDSSARENANTGNWEDLRSSRTEDSSYNSDTNDNTGGAGSTGSAVTNS